MKNLSLIKILILNVIIIVIFIIIFTIFQLIQYNKYSKEINNIVGNIVNEVVLEYPNVSEENLIKILSGKINNSGKNILEKYGYIEDIICINELNNILVYNIIIYIIIIFSLGIILSLIYLYNILKKDKKIKEINKYLKQINNKDYNLKIEENKEDEISKLYNELYKTTVLLKETAENSEKEKEQLSNLLADISHQLKTPIASIRIMLDNINENPNMEETIKQEFIIEISKQIEWISSLVISLLKISKFDAGVIKMNNSNIQVKKLINNIINNLVILIELKNIEIITEIEENVIFVGDYKWQLEALTNILKNAIEYSKDGSKIYIQVKDTKLFAKIIIKDEGSGIDKKDLKHIFERFYKTKNANNTSIGIGLSLAKMIIEKNNGYIKVESQVDYGTTFEIKYLK